MDMAGRVRRLVEPVLAASGLELFDVELSAGVLRVYVDKPGGIDLDTVSRASESISDVLDHDDPLPGGGYTLEVSSPGVERPLRTPDHFRRAVGTQVTLRTRPGVEGDRRVTGRLDGADDDAVELAGRRIPYAAIERARTVFEWGSGPEPSPTKKRAVT